MDKSPQKTWNFDNVLVDFFNTAKERRAHLSKGTLKLFRRNEVPFLTELRRQAVHRRYSGRVELSEHDYDVGIYYNVLHSALGKKRRNDVREMLAPAVRALVTDEDPEGRDYLLAMDDPGLFCQILAILLRVDFDDGVCAFLAALLLKHWDRLDEVFDDNGWRIVAAAAVRLEKPLLAASAFLRSARTDREPGRRHEAYFEASRSILMRLRDKPRDPAECRYMQSLLDAASGNLDDIAQFRVLRGLLAVWTAKTTGTDEAAPLEELFKTVARGVEEWDAEQGGEDGLLRNLEPAVKVPLEWSAYVACLVGDAEPQIASFPTPVYADGEEPGFFPPAGHVNGIRLWDAWDGLLPKLDPDFTVAANRLMADAEPTQARVPGSPIQLTNPAMVSDYTVLQSRNRATCDISALGVSTRAVGRGRKRTLQMVFPFLSKDCPANAANATGRPWEYFVWRDGIAADARIELASGKHICATLPFFASDRLALVRGFSSSLLLAAFPLNMKKAAETAGSGRLSQRCGDPHFIRSATDIVARVVSVSPATLWNGARAWKFLLHVRDLGCDLPAFVGPEAVEGGMPAAGDTVECRAWLFADFREPAESFDDFRAAHPNGVAMAPAPVEPPAEGEGETFLLECHVAGTSHIEDAAGKTAELQRDSPLYLRREPGNEYDRDAIAIYTAEENRIGYVPQKHNPILSRLLDGGRTLIGRVASREVVDDYVRMRICIYLR